MSTIRPASLNLPIPVPSSATGLAMVPLMHSVLWGPMAIAIMGGLASATVLIGS